MDNRSLVCMLLAAINYIARHFVAKVDGPAGTGVPFDIVDPNGVPSAVYVHVCAAGADTREFHSCYAIIARRTSTDAE
jgi:hypothetical protein